MNEELPRVELNKRRNNLIINDRHNVSIINNRQDVLVFNNRADVPIIYQHNGIKDDEFYKGDEIQRCDKDDYHNNNRDDELNSD